MPKQKNIKKSTDLVWEKEHMIPGTIKPMRLNILLALQIWH